jgi:two-component system chemotaxis response regulator CheY
VLVVDDAPYIRDLLKELLQSNGYDVIEASNGREALAKYMETKPDLVTLDIMMPEMDGLETLGAIRSIDPNASIIMVTSLEQKSKIEDAIVNGAKGFITKPFKKSDILGVVHKILNGGTFSYKIERIRIVFNKAMSETMTGLQEVLKEKAEASVKNIDIIHRPKLAKLQLGEKMFAITFALHGESEGRVVITFNFIDARKLIAMMLNTNVETIGNREEGHLKELFQIVGGKIVGVIESFTHQTMDLGSVEFHQLAVTPLEHLLTLQDMENTVICEASILIPSKEISVDILLWTDADKLSALL